MHLLVDLVVLVVAVVEMIMVDHIQEGLLFQVKDLLVVPALLQELMEAVVVDPVVPVNLEPHLAAEMVDLVYNFPQHLEIQLRQ
jgi:hypothetical protein